MAIYGVLANSELGEKELAGRSAASPGTLCSMVRALQGLKKAWGWWSCACRGLFLWAQGFFGDMGYCGKLGVIVGFMSCVMGTLSCLVGK